MKARYVQIVCFEYRELVHLSQDIKNFEEPDKWTNWMDYLRTDYQGHRHHKHH